MEAWRKVWREGVAPQLPTAGLVALRQALRDDDPQLIQGATVSPPPLACVQDWQVEGGCPIAYCGWQGGLATVGEVEEFFAQVCLAADEALAEPAGCRWLINAWDELPRDEARSLLLPEVERVLKERGQDVR